MDVFNTGEEILNSVTEAVRTGDYSRLNRSVQGAIDGMNSYNSMHSSTTSRTRSTTSSSRVYSTSRQTTYTVNRREDPLYKAAPYGFVAPAMLIGGAIMAGFNFLIAAVGLLSAEFSMFSFFGVIGLIALAVALRGSQLKKFSDRYRYYVRCLKGKEYATFEDLGKAIRKSARFVSEDIKRMIGKGLFKEGHVDEDDTMIIASNEMFRQYLQAQSSRKERESKEAQLRKEEEIRMGNPALTEEGKKMLREGYAYIDHIRKCNEAIPGEEISNKLFRLEMIMTRIFNQLEKDPSLATDLRKFMNYYLPTTGKLVEAYKELDAQPVQGENIQKTKKEIEDSLDTINSAFEQMFDSFFEEKAWDISSDINVMKNMLKQEGLTGENDFRTMTGN